MSERKDKVVTWFKSQSKEVLITIAIVAIALFVVTS